ncbi:MAG: DNA alkylation repair protein [Deltaproteobacteria bacterium]|nr:DNA alkylation repair protein [Deltaproteobacteria bacterium]
MTTVSDALRNGEREAATLTECLAVDTLHLLKRTFADLALTPEQIAALSAKSITARMASAGATLYAHRGLDAMPTLLAHPSDTVRSWAPYVLACAPELSLEDRIARVRVSADDPHFGVREWAWMALRPHLAQDLTRAIATLTPWTRDPSPNIRRFVTEATRPRGVWCKKIDALVREPQLALPLLDPLCSDPERYVQNSVANWLNDASKSQPAWVQSLCKRWRSENKSKSTEYICKRALRTLTPRA